MLNKEALYERLNELGWSLMMFCAKSSTSATTLIRALDGKPIRDNIAFKWCKTLDMKYDDLFIRG